MRYRYVSAPLDREQIFNREYQRYLRDDTGATNQEPVHEFDEFAFMRSAYLQAFPVRRTEFTKKFTEEVKRELSFPVNTQEHHAFVVDLMRPLINCPSMEKIGDMRSGRWICGLDTFLGQKKLCSVYSFNWNVTDLTFESDILQKTNCIVHVFDPFLRQELKEEVRHLHAKLYFHDYTLGPLNDVRYLFDELEADLQSVEERHLIQIMSNLGHKWVDIVKLDYNGEDANKLMQLLGFWKQVQRRNERLEFPVGQLLFNVNTAGDALQIVRTTLSLMNSGLAVYHTEPNLRKERPWETLAFSAINMRDQRTFENSNDSETVE